MNQHSMGNRTKQKNSKQTEDSCELWVTLKVDSGEKTVGVQRASSKCLISSLGRMLEVVGICSTMLGPSTQYCDVLLLTSCLTKSIKFHSFPSSIPSKKLSSQAKWFIMFMFYSCFAMANCMLYLFSLNTGTKPDFRALT